MKAFRSTLGALAVAGAATATGFFGFNYIQSTQFARAADQVGATREQLADAAEEIARSLRRGGSPKGAINRAGKQGTLQDRLVDFEAAHPQLAGVVTRLLDGLAQLGI